MCVVKDDQSAVLDRQPEQDKSHEPSGPRIRCPLCGWTPGKNDQWACSYGHQWNTFDTGGVCPACLHHWTSTQCPKVLRVVAAQSQELVTLVQSRN
jgi:hypothetical protein